MFLRDAAQFAGHGAVYTGVDVSWEAVQLTSGHLITKRLRGHLIQADAQALPFADGWFQHIYSFGAIHHSPDTEAIVREMHRVLRPGGTACVMVYHKNSVNYWFEIMFLRKILRYLLAPRWAPGLICGADPVQPRKAGETA